jgi:ketosteroid isomerase-like protein
MRIAFPAWLLALLLIASPQQPVSAGRPGDPGWEDPALGELRALNDAFWRTFSERDLWRMGRLWARDENVSAIFPASSTPLIGWDDVRENFRKSFAHNRDIKIDPRIVCLRVSGNAALLVDSVLFEAVQTQTGQPVIMNRMLGTKVLEKSGGRWRVVHFHAHYPGFVIPDPTRHKPAATEGAKLARQPEDVARASDAFYGALTGEDLAAMAPLWAGGDDVSAIHPSNPAVFLGHDAVMASWKQAFADIEAVHVRPYLAVMRASDRMAWVVDASEFHIGATGSDSLMHLHNVLSTQVFEQQNGKWMMVHYHGQIGFSFEHTD